jgi:hypothetical protein
MLAYPLLIDSIHLLSTHACHSEACVIVKMRRWIYQVSPFAAVRRTLESIVVVEGRMGEKERKKERTERRKDGNLKVSL